MQRALVETLGVPERDRFQIVTEHAPGALTFDRSYLDIERSEAFVLVHVTLAAGRTTAAKQAFYARLAELLADAVALPPEDLSVVLVENDRGDWSFGHGRASYLELPRERWR
ncbi:MAG TPA: tautomerase family protein [Solirubrobacteraceae bacterium]